MARAMCSVQCGGLRINGGGWRVERVEGGVESGLVESGVQWSEWSGVSEVEWSEVEWS